MIDISRGRYWDRPWSLVDGCTPCSPGCDHCWSASMAHRYRRGVYYPDGRVDMSITNYTDTNGRFDGRIKTNPDRLDIPLKRKKPTVYAVWNDLFHEAVPLDFIDHAFLKISYAQQHTFLILTKRPGEMLSWAQSIEARSNYAKHLDNVYFGLTVCNQQEADEKIPVFLRVPGKKFLSIEPMLGKMDITKYIRHICGLCDKPIDRRECGPNFDCLTAMSPKRIDAVILGGETGPRARPMHADWVRSVRNQCAAAGVPFFLKHFSKRDGRVLDGRTHDELPWRSSE
jgi:protein gp37